MYFSPNKRHESNANAENLHINDIPIFFFIKYFSKFYSTAMNKMNNKFQKKVSLELLPTVKI